MQEAREKQTAGEGECQVGQADPNRLQQRCLRTQAAHLEDPRREAQDGIDARELIERKQERERNRPPTPEALRNTRLRRWRREP